MTTAEHRAHQGFVDTVCAEALTTLSARWVAVVRLPFSLDVYDTVYVRGRAGRGPTIERKVSGYMPLFRHVGQAGVAP